MKCHGEVKKNHDLSTDLLCYVCSVNLVMLRHLIRHDNIFLETILEGKVEERRGTGNSRKNYILQMKEKMNIMTYKDLKVLAESRE